MASYIYKTGSVATSSAQEAVAFSDGTIVTANVRRVDLPNDQRQSFLELKFHDSFGNLTRTVTIDSIIEPYGFQKFTSFATVDLEALANGTVAVVYDRAKPSTTGGDLYDIQIQRYSSSGQKIGNTINPDIFDPPANPPSALYASLESEPELASRADGGFNVTWRDTFTYIGQIRVTDVSTRSFDAFGSAITGETIGAFSTLPESAVLSDGSTLNFSGTFSSTVTLKNAAGQVQGSDFQLNRASAEHVFALPGGRFGTFELGKFDFFEATNVGRAPVITSLGGGNSASLTLAEQGSSLAFAISATEDALNYTGVTWSIVGGVDAGDFTLNQNLGQVYWSQVPNFEAPRDSNGDNVYELVLQASVGPNSAVDTQTVTIAVQNVDETLVISSNGGGDRASVNVAENSTAVSSIQVNSFGSPITYSIIGGADAAAFEFFAPPFQFSGNQLVFKFAPNFESPTDTDRNNSYEVVVQASSINGSDTQTITVNVTDINENPTINGSIFNDYLIGTNFNDRIFGFEGNDTLDGGLGFDDMFGGAGNDLYIFDTPADDAIELAGEGIDTVHSTRTFTLDENVENGMALGTGVVGITGNALNNNLIGNASQNNLNGGAGQDTMTGGAGNDTYTIDRTDDVIVELAGGGTDQVRSATVGFTLGANIENGTLTGSLDLAITGNDANNNLTGNAGDNVLDGGLGNDTIIGGAGDDISNGGAGNDSLRNSNGSDRLSGGLGADRFIFSTELKSDFAKSLFDYILDFNRAEGDLIDLKAIDADTGVAGNQAFTLVREGPGFLGGAGEIYFVQFAQNGTFFTNIYGNTDADPDVDFVIGLVGTFDLTAQDFLL